jgi:hypothetical protein
MARALICCEAAAAASCLRAPAAVSMPPCTARAVVANGCGVGTCYFPVFSGGPIVECAPKVRQGYKGHVLERGTDVQEKKKAPYFQPGVQAFGD